MKVDFLSKGVEGYEHVSAAAKLIVDTLNLNNVIATDGMSAMWNVMTVQFRDIDGLSYEQFVHTILYLAQCSKLMWPENELEGL